MCPATFSHSTQAGLACLITLNISGQRWRGSSAPFRFPAVLNGWQGYPPVIRSIPAYKLPSSSLISRCTGTSGKFLFSTLQAKSSISQNATVSIPAHFAANAKPPMPLNKSKCVIAIPVSNSALSATSTQSLMQVYYRCGACALCVGS